MKKNTIFLAAVISLLFSGCYNNETNNDSKLCASLANLDMSSLDEAKKKCNKGDSIAFLPSSFGNEQYPIVAASLLCDISKNIVSSNGGFYCVFSNDIDRRLKILAPEK